MPDEFGNSIVCEICGARRACSGKALGLCQYMCKWIHTGVIGWDARRQRVVFRMWLGVELWQMNLHSRMSFTKCQAWLACHL